MKLHLMSITDFARYKSTSRQTIYNNLSSLTVDTSYGSIRIVMDEISEKWQPKEKYKPKKGIEFNDS